MEGRRLGPYLVETELGSGAMGTVHLARVIGDAPGLEEGQRIAIKLLHPHLLAQPGFFKRFMRERRPARWSWLFLVLPPVTGQESGSWR